MRTSVLWAACLALLAVGAGSTRADGGVTAIRAGAVFTGEELLADTVVVLEGERVRELVPARRYVPAPGDRVVEAPGMTVIPGLIDAHVHLLSMPLPYLADIRRRGWGRAAAQAVSRVPGNRESFLRNGVTTVIDMGAPAADLVRLRRDLESGRLLGPDLWFAGPLFTAPGGHPAGTTYRGQHGLIDRATVQVARLPRALARVDALHGQGVDFIKLVVDDGAFYGPRKVPRLSLEAAKGIIDRAHAHGLPAIAHLGADAGGFSDLVALGVDGVEHDFAWPAGEGVEAGEALFCEMAARGTFFTPTLVIYELLAPRALAAMQESVRRAHAAGVPIAAGTDFPVSAGMDAGENLYRELRLLEEAGLTRLEALRAATADAARKIGRDGEAGRLLPGRRANLVLLEGDVREGAITPQRVRQVILHGRVVFDDGRLREGLRRGLRYRPAMLFPYAGYDALAGGLFGLNLMDFDLFRTGIALTTAAAISTRGAFGVDLALSPPSPVPATTLEAAIHFDNFPRRWFGWGNDTRPADALIYGSRLLEARVGGSTALGHGLRLGTAFLLSGTGCTPLGGDPLPAVTGMGGGLTTALQLEVAHDTRDSPAAPWSGGREALSVLLSGPLLGSSYTFQRVQLDLRRWLSLSPPGASAHHVLAGRLVAAQSFGGAPFPFAPDYGGPTLGRGFPSDRFLGDVGLYAQLEYRFPVWSVLGGVLFADAGQVRGAWRELTLDGFHPCAGAGLRVAFSESSILAADLGFNGDPPAEGGWAFWIRTGHAF